MYDVAVQYGTFIARPSYIQPQRFFGAGEEDIKVFLSYMGMAPILFNGVEPFEHIINTLSTEGPMWNLLKIAQAVFIS